MHFYKASTSPFLKCTSSYCSISCICVNEPNSKREVMINTPTADLLIYNLKIFDNIYE